MDFKRAKQIIEAFGPNTPLYECNTPEDVVKDFAGYDDEHRTEANWAAIQLSCAAVIAENGGFYSEWADDMEPGVIERLAAIGIDPTQSNW
jgi:hypothetical protein